MWARYVVDAIFIYFLVFLIGYLCEENHATLEYKIF